MKTKPFGLPLVHAYLALMILALTSPASAEILANDAWTNSVSGLWRIAANWSGGLPTPSPAQIQIKNANTKTVTIDAATAAANLVVNNLILSGSGTTTNTLLMADVGTNTPLTVLNSFQIYTGGALSITNSALVVTGSFTFFDVWAGSATLDSGSIRVFDDTTLTRIGLTNAALLTLNGGTMQARTMLLGDNPVPQFKSQGTLRMTGGLLSLSSELSIADGKGCTGIVFMVGGQLKVANNLTNVTRVGSFGRGEMTVSNAAVELPTVSVGRHDGSLGTLTLQNNALVKCLDDLSIGRFTGATGAVVVTGGQLVATNQAIWVGREGVGQLTVSNGTVQALSIVVAVRTNTARGTVTLAGGSMFISSNFLVGAVSISTGLVAVVGGDLIITNDSNSAALDLPSGVLTFSGGSITADSLLLTNSPSQFVFTAGTLRTKASTVANGSPFVVGDGTNQATLQLLGGTHAFANGLIISSNATLAGCGTIVGSVTVLGTNALTCQAPPTIGQPPQSQTVPVGATVSFTVAASGPQPLSYQWRFNSNPIADATTSSYAVTNAQTTNSGSYDVIVTNNYGSATSLVAVLTVLIPPSIAAQPVSLIVTQGNNATFSATAGGDAPLSYQWRLNGSGVSGAITTSFTVSNAQTTNAGNYQVVVSNNAGSVTSQVATLTVRVPPSVTQQPVSLILTQGSTATFSAAAAGDLPRSYQWRFGTPGTGGGNIAGAMNATLVVSTVLATNAGNYRLSISNAVGAVLSSIATLNVVTSQPQSQTVAAGDNAAFGITVTTNTPLNYQWRFNGTDIPGATKSTHTVTNAQPARSGSYTVGVSNGNASFTSSAADLRVLVPPILISPSLAGNNFSFSFASVNGSSYFADFKNALTNASWTTFTNLTGTGGVLLIQDTPATRPSRFYRVRVQ